MTSTELYVRAILAMAPLLVTAAWRSEGYTSRWAWASGVLFGATVLLGTSLTPLGVVPWLLVTSWRGVVELRRSILTPSLQLARLSRLAAALYLPVASLWALADLLAVQPLGFSAMIVLLTAVHFHYAGFVLPWLTSRLLELGTPTALGRASSVGVIIGVPLVAVGITSSQLELPWWIESTAASVLAFSAVGIAQGYLRWANLLGQPSKGLFRVGAVALALGMSLAVLYGWRYVLPLPWLSIPAMIAAHGTLNSWGFCLPCVLGNLSLGGARGAEENASSIL